MKKQYFLVLALTLSCIGCLLNGCQAMPIEQTTMNSQPSMDEYSETTQTQEPISTEDIFLLTQQEFLACFSPVTITAENWNTYFSFEEIENIITNDSHEPTGEIYRDLFFIRKGLFLNESEISLQFTYDETYAYRMVDSGSNKLLSQNSFEMMQRNKTISYNLAWEKDKYITNVYHITTPRDYSGIVHPINEPAYKITCKMQEEYINTQDNWTCISAKGEICPIVIPEEYWNEKSGSRFVAVKREYDQEIVYFYENGNYGYPNGTTYHFGNSNTPSAWKIDFLKEQTN